MEGYETELKTRIVLGFMGGAFACLIFLNTLGFVW